ncbi:MAG: ABC transporter ATP-binding protein [Alphaproteobacteria bacterium]|nr:ABC transporter ATP-binding protein [Alphaproteobacteria bacterium]MCB9698284.1 ABC transporter ATP-binding protein [Alphaproteobacteria bacterium]
MTDTSTTASKADDVLVVNGLRTWFHTEEGTVKAVDDVSLRIGRGQTLGVVGESGSGKSVTALTVMGLLPERVARIAGGNVALLGREMVGLPARELGEIRGRDVAMIFQEPMTSLNPVMRVGDQVAEAVVRHRGVSWAEGRARAVKLFDEVGIPDPARRVSSWPHEMSGGQKQRVMIAMALACDPQLLIADEPTTALDVTIQAQILDLIRDLSRSRQMSVMFITHDLGVIAEIADDVAVMFRGSLVEYGPVADIFRSPKHPYTRGLLACRPQLDTPYKRLPTVDDFMEVREGEGQIEVVARQMTDERLRELTSQGRDKLVDPPGDPLLEVRGLQVHFPKERDLFGRPKSFVKAVDGIDFSVWRGQTLGLVGESGCGKTTTGRALLQLIPSAGGTARYRSDDHGQGPSRPVDLLAAPPSEMVKLRRDLQIIFQDPYSSLNPRMTVEQTLVEPMFVHGIGKDDAERKERAATLLEEVGLPRGHLRRYPHEFSGGQRQRICIARTLAVEPRFIICDESVSALDVSVQAQVLNLLKELQERRGLTYVFISHDLSVVKFMSDTMCVMKDGKIVESGPAEAIYADPREEYTRNLIAAIPRGDVALSAR